MALKQQNRMMAAFSMASMTDIVFLLLVFFMVTSTFVFPTALEVDLPQSTEQTPVKPAHRVFIDREGAYYVSIDNALPEPVQQDSLASWVRTLAADTVASVAVYADAETHYGKVVEVLNIGAANGIKMVLATRPATVTPTGDDSR